MVNFEDLPSTKTPINAANLNKMQTDLAEAHVKKTGDTMTGNLVINNDTNSWKQFAVQRVMDEKSYYSRFGTGAVNNNPCLALELYNQNNTNVEARIELRNNKKLYNAKTEKEFAEIQTQNIGTGKGQVLVGNILIQFGQVEIIPEINTPTKYELKFPYKYKNSPNMQVSPISSVVGTTLLGIGVTDITTTGANIYITRTNTTTTYVSWFAIGIADDTVTKL